LAALIGLFALLLLVVFGFVGVGVWWIETRFGSNMAAGVLIALLALITASGAALLTYKIMAMTQQNSSDMIASVSDSFRARAQVDRGYAAVDASRAKMELIDYQQVVRLGDQRAGRLVIRNVSGRAWKRRPLPSPTPRPRGSLTRRRGRGRASSPDSSSLPPGNVSRARRRASCRSPQSAFPATFASC
jgi:hypothetical protein